jgi:hypothetical protein
VQTAFQINWPETCCDSCSDWRDAGLIFAKARAEPDNWLGFQSRMKSGLNSFSLLQQIPAISIVVNKGVPCHPMLK